MKNRRKKLTIFAICGNEEKWIKQWAESVLKLADHVVVSLTQYDDNTEELLRKHIPADKLTLVKYPWEDDFSKARNQALQHIPKDTEVLGFVDMDEVFTSSSIEAFEYLLRDPKEYIVITTIYNALDKNSAGQASLYYPRFWSMKDNHGRPTNPRFVSRVHNQLELDNKDDLYSVRELELNGRSFSISLYHYGYALDSESMAKKHARSEAMLRKNIENESDSFFDHLNLAQLLRAKGDFKDAKFHAEEVMRIVGEKGEAKYKHAAIMALDQIATCYLALGNPDKAIEHSQAALAYKQDHLDSIINLGNAFLEKNDFNSAEYWFKQYLFVRTRYDELKDQTNLILNHLNSSNVAQYNLGMIYAIQGKYDLSKIYFEKCYNANPKFRDVIVKYLHTLKILNQVKRFEEELSKYMNAHPDRNHIVYNYLGDLALVDGNLELAKFNFYQAAFVNVDEVENSRFKQKWESIHTILGPVSDNFFDTGKKDKEVFERIV